MSTGFGLFRNSNFLTSHERVVNNYISVFMYIHLLCSKPGNEKRQVLGSYCVTKHRRKPSHSRRKLNNLNPYLAAMKSTAFQKRLKEMLLHQRANHADQKHQ